MVTIEELRVFLRTVDVSNFPLPIKLTAMPRSTRRPMEAGDGYGFLDVAALEVTISVRHRDLWTELVDVKSECEVPNWFVVGRELAEWTFARIRFMVLHELAECFIVDHVRVMDPHPANAGMGVPR